MKLIPLLHRIMVKPLSFQEFNKDIQRAKSIGLEIPELEDMKRAQASVDQGVVVAIGETAYRDYNVSCPVKVGDTVNYARFAGKIVEVDDVQYVILNDEDCLAVLKNESV
jgi:co-chaperonin GroES (HSP10)